MTSFDAFRSQRQAIKSGPATETVATALALYYWDHRHGARQHRRQQLARAIYLHREMPTKTSHDGRHASL